MIISAPRLFLGEAFSGPGAIAVEDGRITALLPGERRGDVVLTQGFLSPGLIDLHNNGAFGVDCATASAAEWDVFIAGLAARGVTSVLPTIITAPLPSLQESARGVAEAMARHKAILGLHLEGPFLAPEKRGAHQRQFLRLPDDEALDEILPLAPVLRLVTLAPELPGALAAIARLREAGVLVSLGHTGADAATMRAAASAGASLVTHVFNAQSPLSHRAPGAPGVALTDPRFFPCLIADAVHVDPAILAMAFAACPHAVAVSDSILVAGLEPGETRQFGGAPATLGPQGAGLRPDGTIAGAGIILDEGLRRLIQAGVAPETAFAAATSRPAAALGLGDRGRLAPGLRADLVWWSDDFTPLQSWTGGVSLAPPARPRGTEAAREELADLDERPTIGIVQAFLAQEQSAQRALGNAAPVLAELAEAVATKLRDGGRLFYAGAGTSGRLGLLDAVECAPTFGIQDGLIVPLLAGGQGAFIKAVEGAEDDEAAARAALDEHGFCADDALVGIAASGTTPFTLAALRQARALGGLTGAIVNNPHTPMAEAADIPVELLTGAEIIAGSTRLSAGSAQKIALNILSSIVMIRLGKTYGPFMVDMRASNAKLRRRAMRMLQSITGASEQDAALALTACNMHVKRAALMLLRKISAAEAEQALAASSGSLRRALRG
ncbi:MAG TPA: N-acetylmuramic acid 6-phosphate etherase [Acidocella sp.]|jgi:N-acetylmuramic acid 6-phosphate etherase/N-acetylglucosamine-6-phosphate deacetylase|nr:N-acetylmuramic acid 6-phosphate etherase [Acidocella sp.]